jgi:predicted TIM-barrel fold metal-dependent hydrolase
MVDSEVPLDSQLAVSDSIFHLFPENFAFFGTFSVDNYGNTGFTEETIEYIKKCLQSGAKGIKVWKNIGMVLKNRDGNFVMVDDAVFRPVFNYLEENNIPVLGHLGEPKDCWLPFDRMTDPSNVKYYKNNPQYHMFTHPEVPTYEQQIQARDNLLIRHPDLDFIGAHLGSLEWSLDELAKRLDRFPQLQVDLAARMYYLQFHSAVDREKVRNFIMRYQDRILYATDYVVYDQAGTDFSLIAENLYKGWLAQWTFLATDSAGEARGLKLPKEVIDKIYYKNAERYFHPD